MSSSSSNVTAALPRRVSFSNFPKHLLGDMLRGGADHRRLRKEARCEVDPPERSVEASTEENLRADLATSNKNGYCKLPGATEKQPVEAYFGRKREVHGNNQQNGSLESKPASNVDSVFMTVHDTSSNVSIERISLQGTPESVGSQFPAPQQMERFNAVKQPATHSLSISGHPDTPYPGYGACHPLSSHPVPLELLYYNHVYPHVPICQPVSLMELFVLVLS